MKKLFYLLLLLTVMVSCKKDDDPVIDNSKPAFVMSNAYKYELRWSVGSNTSGWDYARLYYVSDNDTSLNTSSSTRTPITSNGGYSNYVNATGSGGPAGTSYIGISFYSETTAGAVLSENSPVWHLIFIDQNDATRRDTIASGQFTRSNLSSSKVYFIGTMDIDHTANTYSVKALDNPFWLDDYSF